MLSLSVCTEPNRHGFQQWLHMKASVEAIIFDNVLQVCEVNGCICYSLCNVMDSFYSNELFMHGSTLKMYLSTCTQVLLESN